MNTAVAQKLDERNKSMIQILRNANIAVVGGGEFCHKLIHFFREKDRAAQQPEIIGVADINPAAKGLQYARRLGIFTASDYKELYPLNGLEVILEITHDPNLAALIQRSKPAHVHLIDHFQARYLWDTIEVENVELRILEAFADKKDDPQAVEALIEEIFASFSTIIHRRNLRSRQIELELVENERTQSQIIQGSTIPTFVINKDHKVTHWNRALEKLSGYSSDKVVGTNRQWAPFWTRERPTMADVILDQIDENEIHKLYGSQWRKSGLIEGAYEAEVFFPHVGENGKWLWFTAAPIKGPDGTNVGAIETLWDKTEDKKAEAEREQHTSELAALCSIYTALSAPWLIDYRIEAALKQIQLFLKVDDVSIFLRDQENELFLKYRFGPAHGAAHKEQPPAYRQFIQQVASKSELVLLASLDGKVYPELAHLVKEGFQTLALIPISAKKHKSIGVMQIASRTQRNYSVGEQNVLDLIGNRIGVSIENAALQEQSVKSEAKYRSLFNNDPNPIFIINPVDLKILDINERAQECYGYTRQEMCSKRLVDLGDADDQEVRTGLRQLDIGQSILFSQKRHFRKEGQPFYVNINVSHARYGESDVLIATTTDITESVKKETQLIQAGKMTTLGLMAAGMAHEINQPLNVIQVCADFLLKMLRKGAPVPDDDLRTIADDIVANVERATGIIRHVRDFARQSEVIKSKININKPIEDVFKVLGHQIKVHQIELDLDLDPDIPYIMADHNRLEQVFINLVNNALDAMDEKAEQADNKGMLKRLQIKTCCQGAKVIVTVSDNGIGMSEEVKGKLFEPFFTTKKIGKGTGLGVSISYGIIKDYDGVIDVESQSGVGTTFSIAFPVSGQDAKSQDE